MLSQEVVENSQLIVIGPSTGGLDQSFFHMFYNGTSMYIGAEALGTNIFADQIPFYFNINLELNQWYKLVCSQVNINYFTMRVNRIQVPWSFGTGIYTSTALLYDPNGVQLVSKVNIKDLVLLYNLYCIISEKSFPKNYFRTRNRQSLILKKTCSYMYQGTIHITGPAIFETSLF